MDISVIVAVYNSDLEKISKTLLSIFSQKDIQFEIVITDDGSQKQYQNKLNELIKGINATNIIAIYNTENKGTIKNLLDATRAAHGDYIFTIGPGDLLFDPYVLHDLYYMAKEYNRYNIFFGNAVYYSLENKQVFLYQGSVGKPRCPELFSEGKSLKEKKIAFFFGNFIIGASYLRRRKTAIKYFDSASKIGIYAEDMLSTSLALAENEDVMYFDRNVIWYEYGTGISTASNSKWIDILNTEYRKLYAYLAANYPQDRVFKAAAFSHRNGRIKRILYRMFLCPDQFLIETRQKRRPDHKMKFTDADYEYLVSLLFNEDFRGTILCK